MFSKRLVYSILLATALSACEESKRDIRAYYFPVADLKDGFVYTYAATEGDTSDHRYWFCQSVQTDSGLFLNSAQYDRVFEPVQKLREKIVENGSLARVSFLFEKDSLAGAFKTVPVTIQSPNLFPFQVTDSLGVFLFSLRYRPPDDPAAEIYTVRNRRFLGDGPVFDFFGKKYPTVRFSVREAVGHEQDGTAEIEGLGEEWYAEGLGLVYFRRSFSEGKFRYAFRLKEKISAAEWRQRVGPAPVQE